MASRESDILKTLYGKDLRFFTRKCFHTLNPSREYSHNWHIDAIAEHLEACERKEIKRLIINMPPRSMKPVSVETLVTTRIGRKRLGDIVLGDEVLTHTGKFQKVIGLSERKHLPCIQMFSESGRSIVTALDHPFMVPDGWKKAVEIGIGELLALKSPKEEYGTPYHNEESRLLGYIIGDGSVAYEACCITAKDEERIGDIIKCIEAVGFYYTVQDYRNKGGVKRISIRSTNPAGNNKGVNKGAVREWLQFHGLYHKTSYTKRVPSCIMSGNRNAIINFISAYWSCDGTIHPKKNTRNGEERKDLYVGCDSVSKELMGDIQHLLLRLGIDSLVREKTSNIKTQRQGDKYISYSLSLRSQDSVWHFTKTIPIQHKKKESIPKHHVRRIHFDPEYFSDVLVRKEDVGIQECMCIEVENDHTFCANDFVVRNSICASIAWPAWLLGNDPSTQIMVGSYSLKLSLKHSVDTRNIIQSQWYPSIFPNTIIASDQNEKGKFATTAYGQRLAVSVGSASLGEGGDYIIVDDALNPEQAASDVERENANDWYRETLLGRLNDPTQSVIVIVMQRLHHKDLTGMLLEQGGYEHLCLPAINDRDRIISIGKGKTKLFAEGELLHPERLPLSFLENRKIEMSSYAFSGQYLQSPSPEGGGIIKDHWWQLWEGDKPPTPNFILQVYDTAFGIKQTNDYSARTTWGIFTNETDGEEHIILLERMMQRLGFPELRDNAIEAYDKWQPDLVLIEAKASGQPLIDEFRKAKLRVRGLQRNANAGDKVQRAHYVTGVFEQGRVWVPTTKQEINGKAVYKPRPFAQEVITTCSEFPNGEFDDIVDTVVDAVQFLRHIKGIKVGTDYEPEPVYKDESKKRRLYS